MSSSTGDAVAEVLSERAQRIAALESEVKDLKTLLKESEAARAELQSQLRSLQDVLEDHVLSSFDANAGARSPNPPQSLSSGATPVTPGLGTNRRTSSRQRDSALVSASFGSSTIDHPLHRKSAVGAQLSNALSAEKAKSTLLQLRMERIAQVARQRADIIKQKSIVALVELGNVRRECSVFREAFQQQMQRGIDLLSAFRAGVAPGSSRAVAYAIAPPIDSSHPVATQINELCDSMDHIADVLQMQWYTLACFTRGPAPVFPKVRRYLDPVTNLISYNQLGTRLSQYVAFASALNLVNSEMRFPNLMQQSYDRIAQANTELVGKLDTLFVAMRLIRSPYNSSRRTMSFALRTALTVDLCREDVQKIEKKFQALAALHTRRCFQYMYHTVCLGQRFGKVLHQAQVARLEEKDVKTGDVPEIAVMQYKFHRTGHMCDECQSPLGCDDCALIEGRDGELRRLLEERRNLIRTFADCRVQHHRNVAKLVDQLLKILHQYKVAAPSLKDAQRARETAAADHIASLTALVNKGEQQLRAAMETSPSSFSASRKVGNKVVRDIATETVTRGGDAAGGTDQPAWEPSTPASHQRSATSRAGFPGINLHGVSPRDAVLQALGQQPKPPVGPFGDIIYSAEHYFRARRLQSTQDEQRRVLQHNAQVVNGVESLRSPLVSPRGAAAGDSRSLSPLSWNTSRTVRSAGPKTRVHL